MAYNSFLASTPAAPAKTNKNKKTLAQRTSGYYKAGKYSFDDIYNSIMQNSGGSWSGGAYRPDTSAAIASFNKQADANRAAAKTQYDTTIDDLVTKMNRFREANTKSRNNQKQSYLTNQSAIELAKEQADRQSRISNASRGLGGSGLQNIAEIQNELGVQGDMSKLAGENQYVMDDLTSQLKQAEEDTERGKTNAKRIYDDSLRSIASDLANKIAQVNYEADNIYNQSLANARSSYAAASENAKGIAKGMYDLLNNSSAGLIGQIQNMSKKDLAKFYQTNDTSLKGIANAMFKTYKAQLDNLSQQGLDYNIYNRALDNLRRTTSTYAKYGR